MHSRALSKYIYIFFFNSDSLGAVTTLASESRAAQSQVQKSVSLVAQPSDLSGSLCRESLSLRGQQLFPVLYHLLICLLSLPVLRIKQIWRSWRAKAEDGAKQNPTSDRSSFWCQPIHCNPLWPTCESVSHSLHNEFIQLCAGHFVQKDAAWNSIEIFTEIQNDYINWLPFINSVGCHVIKGNQV